MVWTCYDQSTFTRLLKAGVAGAQPPTPHLQTQLQQDGRFITSEARALIWRFRFTAYSMISKIDSSARPACVKPAGLREGQQERQRRRLARCSTLKPAMATGHIHGSFLARVPTRL